jgi:uncharacterized protein (TIGR00255 family)
MQVESVVPMGRQTVPVIQSMTGYGRADGRYKTVTIVVEARSVNHRHCEVVTKLPRVLVRHEERFKARVQKRLSRGRIDVSVSFNGEGEASPETLRLDHGLARQYMALLKKLQRDLGLSGSVDLGLLASYRDIIKISEQPVDDPGAIAAAERVLEKALAALLSMRRDEGRALARDLTARLKDIEGRIATIRRRLPQIVQEHASRLQARVNRLLEGSPTGRGALDPARLAQEVALLADRGDVSEELTRLESHLRQFHNFLRKPTPVGRSLDFLLQEINREVTTIGSKVADLGVTQEILGVKGELEKIREQVQNVE